MLTLGPILLLVVLYAAEYWLGRAEAPAARGAAVRLPGRVRLAGGRASSSLALLYKLLPNTLVRWRPALSGAFVAAGLGEASKWAFGLYVSRALPYLKLYGAIGLVPLFLFWLYLGWLIVLFGLEIAFMLQGMNGRVFERKDPRGALVPPTPSGCCRSWPRSRAAWRAVARSAARASPRTSTCASSRWPSSSRASRRRASSTR